MSVSSGPKPILTDASVILDANNQKSYTGTGSAWSNLASPTHNATMHGTAPYETDTAKCFNFATATGANAASSNMGFTFTTNPVSLTSSFTFVTWIKVSQGSSQVGLFSNSGSGNGYRYGVSTASVYWLIGPSYREGYISHLQTLSSSVWYQSIVVFDRTSALVSSYIDGVVQGTSAMSASQTEMTSYNPGIVRSACCSLYTGKLAEIRVYNAALTVEQIKALYNSSRGKYGK